MNDNLSEIKDVMDFLSTILNINCGGCGISAYVMAEIYTKRTGKKVYCAFLDDDCYRAESNKKAVYSNNSSDLKTPNHIVLEFIDSEDNYFVFDCDGEFDYDNWIWCEKESSLFHLDTSILPDIIKSGHWNPMFTRKKSIPEIEKFTGIALGWALC